MRHKNFDFLIFENLKSLKVGNGFTSVCTLYSEEQKNHFASTLIFLSRTRNIKYSVLWRKNKTPVKTRLTVPGFF